MFIRKISWFVSPFLSEPRRRRRQPRNEQEEEVRPELDFGQTASAHDLLQKEQYPLFRRIVDILIRIIVLFVVGPFLAFFLYTVCNLLFRSLRFFA